MIERQVPKLNGSVDFANEKPGVSEMYANLCWTNKHLTIKSSIKINLVRLQVPQVNSFSIDVIAKMGSPSISSSHILTSQLSTVKMDLYDDQFWPITDTQSSWHFISKDFSIFLSFLKPKMTRPSAVPIRIFLERALSNSSVVHAFLLNGRGSVEIEPQLLLLTDPADDFLSLFIASILNSLGSSIFRMSNQYTSPLDDPDANSKFDFCDQRKHVT